MLKGDVELLSFASQGEELPAIEVRKLPAVEVEELPAVVVEK